MTRRAGIGLAAVAALVAAVLLVTLEPWSGRRARGGSAIDGTASASSPAHGADPRTDELATPSSARARAAGEVDAAKGEASERVLATELAVQAGELRLVRIVVDGPLPEGDRIRAWMIVGAHAMLSWDRHPRSKLRERTERYGEPLVPDGQGRVFLPRTAHAVRVVGETLDQWGYVDLPPDDSGGELVLRLEPVPVLSVQVVDSTGAPASGVEVVAKAGRDRLRAETDEHGVAHIVDVELLSPAFEDPGGRAQPVTVYADELLTDPPSRTLDGRPLPDAPVELVLPPCGSAEVRLVHVDGTPWPLDGAEVRIRAISEIGAGVWRDRDAWNAQVESNLKSPSVEGRDHRDVALRGDRAVLRWLEVGRRFEARFSADGLQPLGVRFDGPLRAGEIVPVELAPGRKAPVLVARIVDARGKPIRGRRFDVELANTGQRKPLVEISTGWPVEETSGSIRCETEDDGRLLVQIHPHARVREASLLQITSGELGVRAPLPDEFAQGVTDLGTIAVAPMPLLVGGVVRGADGDGLSGVTVTVSDHRTRSGRDGRFDVRGFEPDLSSVIATASRSRYGDVKSRSVPIGTDDVELVMLRTGELTVRTWSEEALPPGDLSVRAIAPDGDGRNAVHGDADRAADGGWIVEFRLKKLPAAPHDVEVLLRKTGEVLRTIRGVPVAAGETRTDPRLDPIDVRGILQPRTIRVTSAEGKLFAEIAWRPSGRPEAAWTVRGSRAGERTILSSASAIDVLVGAEGHRSARLDGLPGGAERNVVLEPGVPVRFMVPAAAQLPSGVNVHLSLERFEPPLMTDTLLSSTSLLDDDGAAVRTCDPGSYRATLYVSNDDPGRVSGPVSFRNELVVVADSPAEQTLVLAELSEKLSALLPALGIGDD